jgi:predicted RNase H-like HicB family nuclease
MNSMKYGIVIEKGDRNCSAYVPDLPGCIATGKTVEETKEQIRKAIELHLKGLREDGDVIPEPRSVCDTVEVA